MPKRVESTEFLTPEHAVRPPDAGRRRWLLGAAGLGLGALAQAANRSPGDLLQVFGGAGTPAPERVFAAGPPGVNRLPGVAWLATCLRQGAPLEGAALRRAVDDALAFQALFYGVAPAREAVLGGLHGDR